MLKKIKLILFFCSLHCFLFSQQINISNEEPTDLMRSNGKIYVVVAVVVVIVLGIFIYLYNLDKRISRIENNSADKKHTDN